MLNKKIRKSSKNQHIFEPSANDRYLKSKIDDDLVHETLNGKGFTEPLLKQLFRDGKVGDLAVLYIHCLKDRNLLTEGFLPKQIIEILARHGGEDILKCVLENADTLKQEFKSIGKIVEFACIPTSANNINALCSDARVSVYNLRYSPEQIIDLLSKASMSEILNVLIEYTPQIVNDSSNTTVNEIYNDIRDLRSIQAVRDKLDTMIPVQDLNNNHGGVFFSYVSTPVNTQKSEEEKNLEIEQTLTSIFNDATQSGYYPT